MIAAAVGLLDESLAPASVPVIFEALARMRLGTIPRNQDADDAKGQRAVYVDALREFPEDVVVEACQRYARRDKWFPSVSEILDQCQHLVRWRRVTREALT